jgi:hypothetical protein
VYSDNKPSNPGAKPLNKPTPPPESPSTPPSAAAPPVLPSDDPLKPVVSPAWNELMSILSKHVYDSTWTAKDQARYSHVITRYPYISPETQYSTGMPSPGMQPREACLRAAEEAFFADYRPLSADVAETFVESDDDMKEMDSLDLGAAVVQVSMNGQSYLLRISPGEDDTAVREKIGGIMEMTSTRRKRHIKMKNHKRRKLYVLLLEVTNE